MVNLASMLVAAPNGLWEKIIFAFSGAVKNYALAIILITLCIKLILLPLDYVNRRSSYKMTEQQEKIQPKVEEIKRRYQDPNMQNQKLGELYKKEGFNPLGSCLTVLIVMVLNLVIFFTLFSGLNSMASYKIQSQYEQLEKAYITEYVKSEYTLTDEQISELTSEQIDGYIIEISTKKQEESEEDYSQRVEIAHKSVKQRYGEVKESFLWIKNVWISDSPFSKSIPDFNSYVKLAGLKFENDEQKAAQKEVYDTVMGELTKSQGVNGYFILAVITAVTAFLSQYLLTRKKPKKENFYTQNSSPSETEKAQANSNKAMMIIMPIIMLFFTLSYNAIFALYIITGQLFSMATTPLINKLLSIKKKDKK